MSRGGPGDPLDLPRTKDGRPILSRVDLDAYDPSPTRSGSRDRFFCPLHGGDHQRSLTLDPETGKFKCHTCGEGGTLHEHWPNQSGPVKRAAPLSIIERGQRELKAKARADAERAERLAAAIPAEASSFLGTFDTMVDELQHPECPGAIYLRGRGLDPTVASSLGVGYVAANVWPGDAQRARYKEPLRVGRVVYPLADSATGRTASALGRLCADLQAAWPEERQKEFKELKQRKLTGCPAGVWPVEGLVAAREQRRPVVLVEGPGDALAMLQHPGVPCAVVALIGTANVLPMDALKGVAGVILALDSDAAGVKAARTLRVDLAVAGIAVEVMPAGWLGEGAKDAGELAAAAARDEEGAAARYDQALAALHDACGRLGHGLALVPAMEASPVPEAQPSATPWRPTPKAPTEHFCDDVIPRGRVCATCGCTAWRLRETPGSAGAWLWVCAASADARRAYVDAQTPVAPTAAPSVEVDDDLWDTV